ncbi:MAG: hypothetical protein NTW19_11170 [Planctomycetota bacterium]|nr:hypothetical protein [Planctomycetota bacterium]
MKKLHEQAIEGVVEPDLPVSPEEYARRRARFRTTGVREEITSEPEGEAGDGGAAK